MSITDSSERKVTAATSAAVSNVINTSFFTTRFACRSTVKVDGKTKYKSYPF